MTRLKGGPIADPRPVEWWRPSHAFFMATPCGRVIPNRWLSVSRHVGPRSSNQTAEGGRGDLPPHSGSRDMRQKAQLGTLVWAEMGQIDRRRRRRGCAQTSAVNFLHRRLDKSFSIDGESPQLCVSTSILTWRYSDASDSPSWRVAGR